MSATTVFDPGTAGAIGRRIDEYEERHSRWMHHHRCGDDCEFALHVADELFSLMVRAREKLLAEMRQSGVNVALHRGRYYTIDHRGKLFRLESSIHSRPALIERAGGMA